MDAIKAELERKRKAKAEEFGGRKFVKRSEITQLRESKMRDEEATEKATKACMGSRIT